MKKILALTVFALITIFTHQTKAQMVSYEISDHCDNDYEFYITVTLEGMNSIANDYYQISFSCATLQLFNDTDMPGSDVIDESITQDTVTFKFPAVYINAPTAPNTTVHTLVVNISGANYQQDANAFLKASTPVSFSGQIPAQCVSGSPFDMSPLVTPAGGEFYFFDMDGDKLESDAIVGDLFDPSGTIPPNNYGTIGYEYEAANGCVTKEDFTLSVPIVYPTPSISLNYTNEATCGQADGEAEVTASGGQFPVVSTYWSNGTNGPLLSGVESGVYQAYAKDMNGCIAELDVPIGSDAITATLNVSQPTCWYDKGSVDLNVITNSNYTVWWDFGKYGEDHSNLDPGVYYGTITNQNGCEEVVTADLTVQSPEIEITDVYIFDEECNGTVTDNGEISLTSIVGGDGNYSFNWSNGVTTQNNTALAAGDYTVTITDGNGCSITKEYHVGQYSFNSFYWVGVLDVMPSTCDEDGEVILDFIDDSNEISSYSWSNGSNDIDLLGVGAGEYTFSYTDVYGCSDEITVNVPAIKPLVNPICLITVDSVTTTNLLVWEREETTGISGYNIYREEGNGTFNLRGYTPGTEETVFNDVTASPKVKSWTYKIAPVNSCGVEGPKSIAHRTSHLKRSQNGNDFTLSWNLYEGFDYSNNGIDIYRYTDAQQGWTFVANVSATDTAFTETVTNNAGIDYTLDFVPDNGGCTATKAQNHNSSRSNRTSAVFNPGEGTGDTNNELADMDLDNNVSIYPNPSNGAFNIELRGFENHVVDYTVFDVQGKPVSVGQIQNNFESLNLEQLNAGIYMIQLTTDYHNSIKRIVVE